MVTRCCEMTSGTHKAIFPRKAEKIHIGLYRLHCSLANPCIHDSWSLGISSESSENGEWDHEAYSFCSRIWNRRWIDEIDDRSPSPALSANFAIRMPNIKFGVGNPEIAAPVAVVREPIAPSLEPPTIRFEIFLSAHLIQLPLRTNLAWAELVNEQNVKIFRSTHW